MPKKMPCRGCGTLRFPTQTPDGPVAVLCHDCRTTGATHGQPATYKKRGCRCGLCRAAWASYNAKYAHARRATMRGVTSELVDPASIYERDGWTCGICELPVDRAERVPSPGAATLDHVIPISRGGAHIRANVQLAHFYCNTVKGNREVSAC